MPKKWKPSPNLISALVTFFTAIISSLFFRATRPHLNRLFDRQEHDVSDDQDDEIIEANIVQELPYRLRDDFLSPAERNFFLILREAVGNDAIICPKVRLGDILFTISQTNFLRHTNRVNQKHVDFLLCTVDGTRPLVAIELDDRSHESERAQERDLFKNDAFAAAGLPLVRVQVARSYCAQALRQQLLCYLTVSKLPSSVPYASVAQNAVPTCTKCGVPMVVRTAGRGTEVGRKFYGCVNFPRCREVLPAAE